ncbi:hypothetical protein M9H77_11481 [Catharanthus roseus]|uniref:Uncharacterized protein n=1 Tax=Catharanthus roseus TaxID=4058 RepID=A0ACC0BER7_CATRO|nr:hypothetical protein M9H77_11481 [Catharanthus roseus]
MEDEDSDFLKCLILDDPKLGFSIDCGDDPSYALFLCSLKNDGSSYVLEANEKTRLTKPLKYMENDPNGEDENDLESHAKTEGNEFQSNYDCDYKLFFENMRLEGSNVIYQVQILKILCKPYNKEEHERLLEEITKWKPQHKHRDLHSGGFLICSPFGPLSLPNIFIFHPILSAYNELDLSWRRGAHLTGFKKYRLVFPTLLLFFSAASAAALLCPSASCDRQLPQIIAWSFTFGSPVSATINDTRSEIWPENFVNENILPKIILEIN